MAPKKKGTRDNPQSPIVPAKYDLEKILKESRQDKMLKSILEPKSSLEITSVVHNPEDPVLSDNESNFPKIYSLAELINSSSTSGVSVESELEQSSQNYSKDPNSSTSEISPLDNSDSEQLLSIAVKLSQRLKLQLSNITKSFYINPPAL